MNYVEVGVRLIVGFLFVYLGVEAIRTGRVEGVARQFRLPFLGKGIYSRGKHYFKITGKSAYVIGVFQILAGIYLVLIYFFTLR